MENLKPQGFRLADKKKGLDLKHIQAILRSLANLHARSYVFMATYPGGIGAFQKDLPLLDFEGWAEAPTEKAKTDSIFFLKSSLSTIVSMLEATDKEEMKAKAVKIKKFIEDRIMEVMDYCVTRNENTKYD